MGMKGLDFFNVCSEQKVFSASVKKRSIDKGIIFKEPSLFSLFVCLFVCFCFIYLSIYFCWGEGSA